MRASVLQNSRRCDNFHNLALTEVCVPRVLLLTMKRMKLLGEEEQITTMIVLFSRLRGKNFFILCSEQWLVSGKFGTGGTLGSPLHLPSPPVPFPPSLSLPYTYLPFHSLPFLPLSSLPLPLPYPSPVMLGLGLRPQNVGLDLGFEAVALTTS